MAGLIAISIGLGAEKLGRTISEKRLERKEKKAIAVCPFPSPFTRPPLFAMLTMLAATRSDIWHLILGAVTTTNDDTRAARANAEEAQ
jgi:hypothetical protein